MNAKKSRKFTNGPNTELLALQYLFCKAYRTLDLDVVGMDLFANGCEHVIPIEYPVKNFLKKY